MANFKTPYEWTSKDTGIQTLSPLFWRSWTPYEDYRGFIFTINLYLLSNMPSYESLSLNTSGDCNSIPTHCPPTHCGCIWLHINAIRPLNEACFFSLCNCGDRYTIPIINLSCISAQFFARLLIITLLFITFWETLHRGILWQTATVFKSSVLFLLIAFYNFHANALQLLNI